MLSHTATLQGFGLREEDLKEIAAKFQQGTAFV
jgi:hypothetical protein